jgi:hypothetical protein
MNDEFLSVAAAAALTGKSTDSIRRIIKTTLKEDEDTTHIKTERLPNGNSKYYINAAWLNSYLVNITDKVPSANQAQGTTHKVTTDENTTAIIQILREQLDRKDQEIKVLHTLLAQAQARIPLLEGPRNNEQDTQPMQAAKPKRRFLWFILD